jgi:hypothetical protein
MSMRPSIVRRIIEGLRSIPRPTPFAWQAALLALLTAFTFFLSEATEWGAAQGTGEQLTGQVIGINTAATPPLIQLAGPSGTLIAYFASIDAIAQSGLRFGDTIVVRGQRLSAGEVMVSSITATSPGAAMASPSVPGAGTPGASADRPPAVAGRPAAGSVGAGSIRADPNPVAACGPGPWTTTVSWTSSNVAAVEVHTGAIDGPLFTGGGPVARTQRLTVTEPTVLYLQDVSGGRPPAAEHTLSTVSILVSSADCGGAALRFSQGVDPASCRALPPPADLLAKLGLPASSAGAVTINGDATACEQVYPASSVQNSGLDALRNLVLLHASEPDAETAWLAYREQYLTEGWEEGEPQPVGDDGTVFVRSDPAAGRYEVQHLFRRETIVGMLLASGPALQRTPEMLLPLAQTMDRHIILGGRSAAGSPVGPAGADGQQGQVHGSIVGLDTTTIPPWVDVRTPGGDVRILVTEPTMFAGLGLLYETTFFGRQDALGVLHANAV